MVKSIAGKWRMPLVLLMVAAGLVAARSARRNTPAGALHPRVPPPAAAPAGAPSPAAARPDLFTATEPAEGPFPGSVLPLADGSAPTAEFVVKGNANSMRSHGPGSPYYGRTRAEVWFRTDEDAVAAGFRPWAPKTV